MLPALAILMMLRLPIAFLPMILMQLANLKVALGRITKFLMNEELSDEIKASCRPPPPPAPASPRHPPLARAAILAPCPVHGSQRVFFPDAGALPVDGGARREQPSHHLHRRRRDHV